MPLTRAWRGTTWALLLAITGALSFGACNDDPLPGGQEQVESFCSPYRAVARLFPFDVPPDLNNPGQNLRAREALDAAAPEVDALHDAVRISGDSEAVRAFSDYATAVEAAIDDAGAGTDGLQTPSDWVPYQDELNASEDAARDELSSELEALGVDLVAACPA